MSADSYRIVSTWEVQGDLHDVVAVLAEPVSWPRWWPAAFLDVAEGAPSCTDVGTQVLAVAKGWLPYTLCLGAEVVACNRPHGCRIRVWGDFEGHADCSLTAVAGTVRIVFDWQVRVRKPLIRRFSWLLKPMFVANHQWVMKQGRRSLDLELRRLRARRAARPLPLERPPQPTFLGLVAHPVIGTRPS